MLGLSLSCRLDWGSYVVSIAKTASKKIDSFYEVSSPEIPIYLCKSAIHPFLECCCHVWDVTPSCYLNVLLASHHCYMLNKLQKRICRTAGPSLASIEPLAHR